MKTIRKGNDIVVRWRIFRYGQEYDIALYRESISLVLSNMGEKKEITDYTIVDVNTIVFKYRAEDQGLGIYRLLLIDKSRNSTRIIEECNAFRLVNTSDAANNDGTLESAITITLTSELTAPADGLSAYEVALQNGFIGTEEEWLQSLKGEQGPQGIQGDKGDKGDRGEQGEKGLSAYQVAIANGFVGTEAEWLQSLVPDTTDIELAEAQRHAKELERIEAENARQSAELGRQNASTEAVASANEAASSANNAASSANNAASSANNAASSANAVVAEFNSIIVQETGAAQDKVMSQKAVTDAMSASDQKLSELKDIIVTPEAFGAKGDGVTDDAEALLLTFTKASQNGVKAKLTKEKTYLVNSNPSNGTTLFPFNSLSIDGNGAEIKIGNIGDYHAIFSIRGGITNIRDIVLTLSDDNATTADTGVTDNGRRIDFEVGTRGENLGEVYLDGITINNACGVWQFDLIRVKKAVVKNCVVNYTSIPLTYDRTSCYLWGENIEFTNNTLNGSESAWTGVEFHGTNINVHDNYIKNYRQPIFIVNDLNDMGLQKTESLRLTNNYCHCKRGLEIWASLAYNMGDIIIEDNSFIITDKDYYAFNIFAHVNACTIDNIIVKNNRFLQINEEETLASIRFNPLKWRGSEYGSFLIKNMQFNGNHFLSRSVYLMSLGCTIDADVKIDNIEFISNIFDSQSNIMANIDNGKNTFTSIHFVNNVFKNNTNYIILPYNANGMDIRFDDNVFQKKVGVFSSESGKECITLYGGHINADYMANIPNVKVNTCFDNNGLLSKLDTVKVYAEAATTITAKEETTISVPKGWSEVSIGAGFHIFNAVTKVDFSGMKISLTSLYNAFGGFKGKKIDLSMIDFSRVTSLSTAFAISYIERIDLSSVNASALTGLSSTFYGCSNLKYVDISGFDYSKVSSMQGLFGNCTNLEELHLGKFNVKEDVNVTDIFQKTDKLSMVTLECATQASITNVEQLLSSSHPTKTISTLKVEGAISDTFNAVITIVEQVVG